MLGGGEEVRVEKGGADERLQFGERGVGCVIFGDVARGVAPDEGEVRAGFERDGANEEIAQGCVGSAGFAESEFHQCAIEHGFAQHFIKGGALNFFRGSHD